VADVTSRGELGRGERIMRGVYRLRLPLPWPGVPHCNAWALSAGDGFVLVDTGIHDEQSIAHLERAMEMVGLRLDDVKLVICTHAHSDHCGQAVPIAERAGCELWMHPSHELMNRLVEDPEAVLTRRLEIARQSGVPEEPLRRYAAERGNSDPLIVGPLRADKDLLEGVTVQTDLGEWVTYETPGHAPSHVCLFQPERRLLISGDHLLGRISLYFEYGYSPNPVGEFLHSLDVVERLGARLCLAGHGRTFTDVHAHIHGNRALVEDHLYKVLQAVGGRELTAFDVVGAVYGESLSQQNGQWLLSQTLGYLTHLQSTGGVTLIPGEPERWTA
jgi:glyoxylase-like metal-dependent hydrolase (beta-lactamase superfamily II)